MTNKFATVLCACLIAIAAMAHAVDEVVRAKGLTGGFRVITNTGADAGQTVMHFHMHVLGGCDLGENLI